MSVYIVACRYIHRHSKFVSDVDTYKVIMRSLVNG